MHCVNISLKGFKIDPVIQFAEFKVESFFWLQKKTLGIWKIRPHFESIYVLYGAFTFYYPCSISVHH